MTTALRTGGIMKRNKKEEKDVPALSRSEYVTGQWTIRAPEGHRIEVGEHDDDRLLFKLVKN